MRITTFAVSFILLLPMVMLSQQHFILNNFSGFSDNQRVILTWTIKKNESCIGIGILRSTDKVNYEVIGEYKGICGSAEFAQTYNFVDENPVPNTYNYYVLQLGFDGKTEPPLQLKFIELGANTSKVYPNPAKEFTTILYSNHQNEKNTLTLYDTSGKYVSSMQSNENEFHINLQKPESTNVGNFNFTGPLYYYVISSPTNAIITSGKFIVLR